MKKIASKLLKMLPLYLLLAIPTGYAMLHFLGDGWGLFAGALANMSLLQILMMDQSEEETTGS